MLVGLTVKPLRRPAPRFSMPARAEEGKRTSARLRCWVRARFLPQRLVLDAGDDVRLGDEVIEEAVPFLSGHACGSQHVT